MRLQSLRANAFSVLKGNPFRVGIAIIRAAGTPSGGRGEFKLLRMNPQVTKFIVPLALCLDLYIGNRSSLSYRMAGWAERMIS
ncbi:hypothetical protein DN752_23825 [Echinicola strongylocentroti]|uniref:Uncharacterized protein n=1 Tax=Echinicola strongylocentroti TaxID=1795355 RepID=A0A2Z4IQ61_9BACT|nr:hypothetical protein DN752_23825 [Echinicola strongylocentroti]